MNQYLLLLILINLILTHREAQVNVITSSDARDLNIPHDASVIHLSHQNEPIEHGKIVLFESKPFQNSYINGEIEDCRNKNDAEECGDCKGIFGAQVNTQFKVYKSEFDNFYCFESVLFPSAFLYVQYDRCNDGDTQCGDLKFMIQRSLVCNIQIGFNLILLDLMVIYYNLLLVLMYMLELISGIV